MISTEQTFTPYEACKAMHSSSPYRSMIATMAVKEFGLRVRHRRDLEKWFATWNGKLEGAGLTRLAAVGEVLAQMGGVSNG